MKKLTDKQINALATVLDMAEGQLSSDKEANDDNREVYGLQDMWDVKAESRAIRIVSNIWKRAKKEREAKP